MGQIKVTATELKNKAQTLKDLNGKYNTQIEALTNSEAKLKNMWQGAANDAFHAAFENDKQFMTAFYNLIEKYCAALETIAAKYEEAENRNTDIATTRSI